MQCKRFSALFHLGREFTGLICLVDTSVLFSKISFILAGSCGDRLRQILEKCINLFYNKDDPCVSECMLTHVRGNDLESNDEPGKKRKSL